MDVSVPRPSLSCSLSHWINSGVYADDVNLLGGN
jgi:hypothetical protein